MAPGAAAGGTAAGAAAWALAGAGVFSAMLGIVLPSATLTFFAARWGQRNRERPTVRAFKLAMAPIVVALLVATGRLEGAFATCIAYAPLLFFAFKSGAGRPD